MEQLELGDGGLRPNGGTSGLYEACGNVPPAQFEESHYRRLGEATSTV